MPPPFSYAERPDLSGSDWQVVLLCGLILLVAGLLAFLPVRLGRVRAHRRLDLLGSAALLWGLLAAGSVAYASLAQSKWEHERDLRLKSGYDDPRQEEQNAPAWPWPQWAALAAAYVALFAWAMTDRGAGAVPPALAKENAPKTSLPPPRGQT